MRVFQFFLTVSLLPSAASAADLLIRNVTIVDVTTGAELPKHSVLVHGDQIAAVGVQIRLPKDVHVINGAGKYLIPGLWDMHVHLWYRENQFPLFLANGITGLRDMGSDLSWVNAWRRDIKAGKLLGPHIETSGPPVDGVATTDPRLPVFVVQSPNQARATFDRLDNLDVDFVQVMQGIPRDAYFAFIERARKWYLPVAGNVPPSVRLIEAINARQKSVEHMSGTLLACSRQEEKLRKRLLNAMEKKDAGEIGALQAEILDSYDPKRAEDVFERLARYETRMVPTLVMLRRSIFLDADRLATDPHLPYIAPAIRKTWADPRLEKKKVSEEELDLGKQQYEKLVSLLPVMRRAGVAIMAGTDTGDAYSFPGYDLHRELELLVEAGLKPLEALRAATLEPARYLGAEETLGSIEKGKIADMVLLDADPLKDIRNTQKIDGVIVAGKYLTRAQLNGMLGASKGTTPARTAPHARRT